MIAPTSSRRPLPEGYPPVASIERAWRKYLEAMSVGDDRFKFRDVRNAFFGGALSALLAINDALESVDYAERPKLRGRMRELTSELTQFSQQLAQGRD
jgi:hypothetical protein